MIRYLAMPWALPMLGRVVAWLVFKCRRQGACVHAPYLQLVELSRLLPDLNTVEVLKPMSIEAFGLARAQVGDENINIVYTLSTQAETIDVLVQGKTGFIVILGKQEGRQVVVRITHADGVEWRFPNLTVPELRSVERLFERVRTIVRPQAANP